LTIYIDTSALMRIVLREPGALHELRTHEPLVSSELLALESHRTLDRLRLAGAVTAAETAIQRRAVSDWLETIDLVLLRPPVLSRAAEPLPTALGTLDAVHLASALVWRDRIGEPLLVATHDVALGTAAQAFGFEVHGL